jgi:hypothetical protein
MALYIQPGPVVLFERKLAIDSHIVLADATPENEVKLRTKNEAARKRFMISIS